jgi:hypothetical protein
LLKDFPGSPEKIMHARLPQAQAAGLSDAGGRPMPVMTTVRARATLGEPQYR